MNTLLNRTQIFAFTAALTILGSQAGHCGNINPQPLPPNHPPEHAMLAFFLHLVHLIRL